MEPFPGQTMKILFVSVQEVRSEQILHGENIALTILVQDRYFHVIAAPRPSGRPDLDSIRARPPRGAFLFARPPMPIESSPRNLSLRRECLPINR
jgi:hypothetical protein